MEKWNLIITKFANSKLVFVVILIFCLFSYGLSIDMYFWKDDFPLMIKAQNPEESIGFLGAGIKGAGAYRYVAVPFAFLYPTFGLYAPGYFIIGLLLYFIASISVFYLAREIFDNRLKAFLTALVFSSGYIGADSIYGLTNSYQTSWVIILINLSLIYYLKSFKIKYIGFYILSVFLFLLSLETGFIRAHGFFLIIVSSSVLVLGKWSIKRILEIIFKLSPFFLIFKNYYLNSTSASVGNSQITKSLTSGDYHYFYNPLITLLNVIIPTSFINFGRSSIKFLLDKQITPVKFQLSVLIILILIFILILAALYIKKYLNQKSSFDLRIIIFAIGVIIGSFIGVFYIGAAATYLESTHRYLSTTLVGLSFFWVAALSIIYSKSITKNLNLSASITVICLIYLVLGNIYAWESIQLRTDPQKQFFTQLKKEIPQISAKTFINLDVSNKNNSNGKFGNIFGAGSVGGSTEITMHYPGVDRYTVVTTVSDFQDFVRKFKKDNGNIDNTYWFFFENNNLENRTNEFRDIIRYGKTSKLNFNNDISTETKLIEKNNELTLENTKLDLQFPTRLPGLTDGILKFNLKIIPAETRQLSQSKNEDQIYLEYLLSKSEIKKSSKAKVLNQFQNYTAENMFDSKPETSWMADRGQWHNLTNGATNDIQFIEVVLDAPISLGGILFTNGHSIRTPTKYKILIRENNNWRAIKTIGGSASRESNEIWFDKLDPVITSEIRIEILDSSSHDAPQISEIELVDSKFAHLDFKKAAEIELDPAKLLTQNSNSKLVEEYFGKNGKLSFLYKSNKDNDFNVPPINFSVKGLNETYSYEIPIPANGINLTNAKFFNLNYPGQYIFSDFEYVNPPLKYYLDKI